MVINNSTCPSYTPWHSMSPLPASYGELILISTPLTKPFAFFGWHNAITTYRIAANHILIALFNIMIIIEQRIRKAMHDSHFGKAVPGWDNVLSMAGTRARRPAGSLPIGKALRPVSRDRRTAAAYKRG